jgi:K+ transporter
MKEKHCKTLGVELKQLVLSTIALWPVGIVIATLVVIVSQALITGSFT